MFRERLLSYSAVIVMGIVFLAFVGFLLTASSGRASGQSCPACDGACRSGTSQMCGNTCLNCVTCGPAVPLAVCVNGTVNCVRCPIVIDVGGQGFHLTSKGNGVKFIFSPGELAREASWTDPGYSNGWLALDRNGNGIIDDATELFGDLTPQPPSLHPNGYKALAVYDTNENGKIDTGDVIFPSLRVWVDRNHNGISDPGELLSLDEAGVVAIDLHYTESLRTDQYGNQFRFVSKIWDKAGRETHRCYDVLLLVDPLPAGPPR